MLAKIKHEFYSSHTTADLRNFHNSFLSILSALNVLLQNVKDKRISSGESKVWEDKTVLKETLVVPQWSWMAMLRRSRI